MRISLLSLTLVSTLGLASLPVSASIFMYDDASDLDTETKSDWDASAELGLLFTSGNTETETFKAKLNLARDFENWRHKGVIDYYRSEQKDQVNGGNILTGATNYHPVLWNPI